MKRGGYLIRFVDVVLILLFGFIIISDIEDNSEIILPKSTETPPIPPDFEELIYIGVTSEGIYLLEDETMEVTSREELEKYLVRKKDLYGDFLKVRIRSNYDTPVYYAFAAAQLCDGFGIKKALDVQIFSE
jgi:biopolymer transport protein ExbD